MYIQQIKSVTKNNATILSASEIETHRKEITNFLLTVRQLTNQIVDTDELKTLMWSLMWSMDTFNTIPETILTASSKKLGSAEHQLVHGYLDYKWLTLTIFFKISPEITEIEREQLIKFHILDLLSVARIKFNQVNITELITTKAFPCLCFTEYYLLIQQLMETKNLPHWPFVNDCLKLFEDIKNVFKQINLGDMDRNTRSLQCKNYYHFVLWIICEIAEAQCYDDVGQFLGSTSYRV